MCASATCPSFRVAGSDDFDAGESKASSFLFETGGLCIAHLGDLGSPMNPEQLRRLGKIHVALAIISDPGAMNPRVMAEFVRRLGPNVAIPMDVRSLEELNVFLGVFRRVASWRATPTSSAAGRCRPPPKWCSSSTRPGSGSKDASPWMDNFLVGTGPCACPIPWPDNGQPRGPDNSRNCPTAGVEWQGRVKRSVL